MSLIKLDQVSKIYNNDNTSSIGIQNVSLEFNLGEFVAITGDSGSGKSTLLNVVSMMDSYEEGELFINDKSTVEFTKKDFENYRSNYVSFIFQEYNLIDSFNVLENVMLPLLSRGYSKKDAKRLSLEAIEKVGLTDVIKHKGTHLSGGEKQRTVIARALVSNTPIIACDEPTGNLDSTTAAQVVNILKEVAQDKLILYVTHDYESVRDVATRHIVMKDSTLESDTKLSNKIIDAEYNNKNAKKTKPWAVVTTGFKDVIKTPKKSTLSFLVALLVSFSSVAVLTGAFALVTPLAQDITETVSTYAEENHRENRVQVFGKSSQGKTVKEFFDAQNNNTIALDNGNLLTSAYDVLLNSDGIPGAAEAKYFEANTIGVVSDGDKMLDIPNSKAPEAENEFALGVSRKEIETFATNANAIDYYRRNFVAHREYKVRIDALRTGYINFKPTAVYIMESNEYTWVPLFSPKSLQKFYTLQNKYFEDNPENIDATYENIYSKEAKYTVEGFQITPTISGYTSIPDFSPLNIYLNKRYEGFDLKISFRSCDLVIPTSDIIYTDKINGLYINPVSFQRHLAEQNLCGSIYASYRSTAENLVKELRTAGFITYLGSNPQSSTTSIKEETGYKNLLGSIGYIIMFVASAILIAFLGSLVLGVIYKNQKKDYAIYSSLFFTRHAIRGINFIEMGIFFALSSILSYFGMLIFVTVAKSQFIFAAASAAAGDPSSALIAGFADTFTKLLGYVTNPFFILVFFLFNLLFATLVSTWIMNSFEKKTLANNLRRGGELL